MRINIENKNFFGMIILGGAIILLVVVLVVYFFVNVCRARPEAGAAAGAKDQATGLTTENRSGIMPDKSVTNPIDISNVSGNDPTIVDVVNKVNRHLVLPSGDVTVATILHADELRAVNSFFYKLAKDGDKLLLYPDTAILYDPALDRVLDIWHFLPQ